jgi:hypothetical protein
VNRTITVNEKVEGTRRTVGQVRLFCMAYALAGALAVLAWQAATVHFNYGGNWTALFCTGAFHPAPPELAPGTYVFPSSTGYDGQFYRYVAHDPWLQKGWTKYQDLAVMRYGRILVPALAWVLAGGQAQFIDGAYIGVILLWIFLGIYWLGRWAVFQGRHPAWGLGFLLLPATLTSVDRMTVDVAMGALCVAVLWYAARNSLTSLYVVLVAAALVRETGLFLVGAYCGYALSKRLWLRVAVFATAALPILFWQKFIAAHIAAGITAREVRWLFKFPVAGIIMKLFQPEPYPFGVLINRLIQAVDVVALCGFIVVLGLAVWSLRRWPPGLEQWGMLGFLALAVAFSTPSYWSNVYNYARPFSPLVFLVASRGLSGGSAWVFAPVLLIDLRIAVQLAPQAFGILRGLL